ncbi:steryl-sulfatase-like [Centruroides sculpturatus]|uniref:steryl-sulfatase-like n=1 Tax=Centruroides sculpturatus TaxID=218467 RepID=UPI000C6CB729|nr:steryl-sulfatase-like [Centruroides sculpturatus]XP_023221652.1 steryl-sulfatase-like [Centruroides sculpturatus]XP_023221653.1 steryl-sulfatase-like [Centruroides sculpturatus]
MPTFNFILIELLIFLSILNIFNTQSVRKPNFLIFIADDLGYGDLGCFGNDTIQTPNIDSIANQGAKLTHHLAAAAVCTPSRAALLTGRYPVRSGMESFNRNKVFIFLASKGGLPMNETTFAKVLQKEGYVTALIGKWHLGLSCYEKDDMCHHPLNHGFDYYYGLPLTNLKDFGENETSIVVKYVPHFYTCLITILVVGLSLSFSLLSYGYKKSFWILSLTFLCGTFLVYFFIQNINVLNGVVMRNQDVVEQPVRLNGLTQRFVQEANKFITNNAKHPFLLVMSFVHVHTALFCAPEFSGISKHGRYGDNIEELDWAVGQILETVENIKEKNNTFVYFTSDNGGHLEERSDDGEREGGHNGILKGGKMMGGMEGGIRVPTVVMWPNKIPAKSVISAPTSQMDLFSTILNIIGVPLPTDRFIDGKNILPLLQGKEKKSPHQYLFHYCGHEIHAARYIPENEHAIWKIHYFTPKWNPGTTECDFVCHCFGKFVNEHNPPLLYNIVEDPSENNPLDVNSNPRWLKLISHINKAVKKHKDSINVVPQQFSFINSIWIPWLQPCCNFPWCHCTDTNYDK